MRFPEEIVADKVIPTLRALLSRDLLARGLTQSEVAKALGVSQAAVSKYAHGKQELAARIADDPRTTETVQRVGGGIAGGTMGPVEALAAFMTLIREYENRGPICHMHEDEYAPLRGIGCDLCVKGVASETLLDAEVLSSLRRGIRLLEATPAIAAHLPHVGSNLVMARRDARTELDVAGIPGGLVEVMGRVRAPAEPEFGASRHVAEVLLAVRGVDPSRRAALALAPASGLLDHAPRHGLTVLEFPAELDRDTEGLASHLAAAGVADVLVQTGGFGIEAVAYLFGPDAAGLAETARRVLVS